MSTTSRPTAPTDPAFPGLAPDDLCFGIDEGFPLEVRDAATTTRGRATADYASERGCAFTEVRCVTRHVVIFTRQDAWDASGRDRWADDLELTGAALTYQQARERTPAEPPADWRPGEWEPCWSTCQPDHPRAIKVWCLEERGDGRIPARPVPA